MWTASNAPRSSRDLGEIEIQGGDGDDTELIGIDYRCRTACSTASATAAACS
jgi:hypothetical protein